jgi:cellulose synthase/poly-beta-1,6-N-acetylglucosamine synthase-like glycosyltransferase
LPNLRVTVVVPARDAAATIGECVRALMTQRYSAELREVVVVDDGSRDDTGAIAEREGARVVRVSGRGPAAARNAGVNVATGEIVAFTDADCVPDPNWITQIVAPFGDPSVVATKGTYWTSQPELVAQYAQAEYEEKYRWMARFETIDFVDTYSAAFRRDVLLAVGGFDERYQQASNEDTDLSYRLAERGYKMLFVPGARVRHRFPFRVRDYARRKYRVGYWRPLLLGDHPGKTGSDSHAPPSLRVQVALAGLAAGLGPAALVWRPLRWLVALLFVSHVVVSLPFALRSARKDWRLLAISPSLVLVRSYGLGLGYLAGWLRMRRRVFAGGNQRSAGA